MTDGGNVTLNSLGYDEVLQLGVAAHRAGRFDIAERFYRRAIALTPQAAEPRHVLGLLLRGLGRVEESLELLTASLALSTDLPTSRHALGVTYLNMGSYAAGWPYFEARLDRPGFTPNLQEPMWRGEPLAGKRLAVFPEMGLGDSIHFARFIPILRDRGADVLVLARPPLVRLFRQSFEGVTVEPATGTVDLGGLDYWVMIMSLAARMEATPSNLPSAPYLRATSPHPASRSRPRVGIVTKGNPAHENDARRSLPAGAAARLLSMPDVETISLHPENTGAKDFADTADIVAGLDLVISVDSSVGHLAGAMGKSTLLLVPGFLGEWRWINGREDTAWYPNHRLIRSRMDGDWGAALDQVEQVVCQLAGKVTG